MQKEIGFNLERKDDGKEPLEGDRQGGKDRPDPEDVNEAVTNRQNRWKQFFLKKQLNYDNIGAMEAA